MKRFTSMALVLSMTLMVGGLTSCSTTSSNDDSGTWLTLLEDFVDTTADASSSTAASESVDTFTTEPSEETLPEEELQPEESSPEATPEVQETPEPEETPEIEEPEEELAQPEVEEEDQQEPEQEVEQENREEEASATTSQSASTEEVITESAVTSTELPSPTLDSIKKLRASSELIEENNLGVFYHVVKNLFDGSTDTAWVEDVPGNGVGEWVEFDFNDAYTMSGVIITNGYQKNETVYYNNGRIEWFKISFSDGSSYETFLDDRYGTSQTIELPTPVTTTGFRIQITSVYPGALYEDTCMTELRVF